MSFMLFMSWSILQAVNRTLKTNTAKMGKWKRRFIGKRASLLNMRNNNDELTALFFTHFGRLLCIISQRRNYLSVYQITVLQWA